MCPDSLPQAVSLNWFIYPDAGGVPGGHPESGGEVWSHTCLPGDTEVTFSGANSDAVTLDIIQAQGWPLYLPPGTYWLCFYPSWDYAGDPGGHWFWWGASTNNLMAAQLIDPTGLMSPYLSWTPWPTVTEPVGPIYDAAFRLEGTALKPPPPTVKYLHCTDGLFNLTDPLNTPWHELWPIFCREYHLSSWDDNGDSILSYCDTIDMYEKPDGELRPYHIEEVTITLLVAENKTGKSMYIELEGCYNASALVKPIGTQWHEIYPVFCMTYNLTGWMDNDSTDLDYCDYIWLWNKHTGEETEWHVEEVAIDIVVTPEPPPVGGEAYPASKASLLAPWIAVGAVLAGLHRGAP